MAKKYKITYDRDNCIGAASCTAVSPKYWEIDNRDGKANLKGAKFNDKTKRWELIVDEKEYQESFDAAEACPVDVIKVEEIK